MRVNVNNIIYFPKFVLISKACLFRTTAILQHRKLSRHTLINPSTFLFHGATAPPGSGSPHYRYFTITLRHTSFGRTPQPDAETPTWHHVTLTRENMHAPAEIRTHNPSMREAAGPRLRPRGYWDKHWSSLSRRNVQTDWDELEIVCECIRLVIFHSTCKSRTCILK